MKKLPLTNGGYTLVDDEDFDRLSKWKWYLSPGGYVVRDERIFLHKVVREVSEGYLVDHINRNKLDNRSENLRPCTFQQNQFNRRKRFSPVTSYKGINFFNNRWVTRIKKNKESMYIGYFDKEHHAALVYDLWAKDLFGEFAYTNFPIVASSADFRATTLSDA